MGGGFSPYDDHFLVGILCFLWMVFMTSDDGSFRRYTGRWCNDGIQTFTIMYAKFRFHRTIHEIMMQANSSRLILNIHLD